MPKRPKKITRKVPKAASAKRPPKNKSVARKPPEIKDPEAGPRKERQRASKSAHRHYEVSRAQWGQKPDAKHRSKSGHPAATHHDASAKRPGAILEQPEIQEKIRELIKLAKEQGYLTFDDLNEALPDNVNDPDEMETIMGRLRGMEIDIIEASEVDRYKDVKKDSEEEEEKPEPKLDILDDPVRMYLKQMGQVPLLTREQEVEISKRIEDAEINVQKHINRFGFIARAYLDLAQKLIERRERFDRVILDKKIESRERYMKHLPKSASNIRWSGRRPKFHSYRAVLHDGAKNPTGTKAYKTTFQEALDSRIVQKLYPKFFLQAEGHRGVRAAG